MLEEAGTSSFLWPIAIQLTVGYRIMDNEVCGLFISNEKSVLLLTS